MNPWKSLSLLLTSLLLYKPLMADELGGLQISGAADLVADFGFQDADKDRRLEVRSVELMLFGPTDHLFEGMISFAAHQYNGEFNLSLHEAYIKSSSLIPRSQFQVGQFFLDVGRLNSLHQHDWPFIHAPLTQSEFFDGEGIIDAGAQYSWLSPLPFYLRLTAGITSGWRITHSHGDEGKQPKIPTHYLKTEFFHSLPADGGLLWGLNYLGRKDAEEKILILSGAHAVAKWRDAKVLRWMIQSEIWNRHQNPKTGDSQNELGGYVFTQYGWSPLLASSLRFDYLTQLDLEDLTGKRIKNYQMQIGPELSLSPSEFAKFRFGYSYGRDFQEAQKNANEHIISLQSVFILGAHPAHEF